MPGDGEGAEGDKGAGELAWRPFPTAGPEAPPEATRKYEACECKPGTRNTQPPPNPTWQNHGIPPNPAVISNRDGLGLQCTYAQGRVGQGRPSSSRAATSNCKLYLAAAACPAHASAHKHMPRHLLPRPQPLAHPSSLTPSPSLTCSKPCVPERSAGSTWCPTAQDGREGWGRWDG